METSLHSNSREVRSVITVVLGVVLCRVCPFKYKILGERVEPQSCAYFMLERACTRYEYLSRAGGALVG